MLEKMQGKAGDIIRGLEHLLQEERAGKLALLSLEKDLIHVYKYLVGGSKDNGV